MKLEDHFFIKGMTYNFKLKDNKDRIPLLVKSFFNIWKSDYNDVNDSKIIRAFLTTGDYTTYINWSVLGGIWFFGHKYQNGWNFILTKRDNKFSDIFLEFLSESAKYHVLQDMINKFETNFSGKERNWRYYFIKYPEFTSTSYNLYSLYDDSDFLIRNLSATNAGGSHINPYLRTLARTINKKYPSLCNEDTCKSCDGIQNFKPLLLKINDLEITVHCKEKYWELSLNKEPALKIKEKFSLTEKVQIETTLQNQKSIYDLKSTEDKDMIEIAVEFISELYQLENSSEQKKSEIRSDSSQ